MLVDYIIGNVWCGIYWFLVALW